MPISTNDERTYQSRGTMFVTTDVIFADTNVNCEHGQKEAPVSIHVPFSNDNLAQNSVLIIRFAIRSCTALKRAHSDHCSHS